MNTSKELSKDKAPVNKGALPVTDAKNVSMLSPEISQVVDLDDAKSARKGWLIFLIGFCGFLIWAAFAPLDQGSVVPSTLVAEGNRKTIQHLTGGIVEKINVKEGQLVKAGDVLVEINPVRSKAELEATRGKWINLAAARARLLAEMATSKSVSYPSWFKDNAQDERVQSAIELQDELFSSRVRAYRAELSGLQESLAALEQVLQSKREGGKNQEEVLRIKKEQLDGLKEMVDSGYMPKNAYLDALRDYNAISSGVYQDSGQISELIGQVARVKQQIAQRRSSQMAEIQTDLANTQAQLDQAEQSLQSANFYEQINQVRSPVDGYVVGLKLFTEGGVVSPGQVMMEIAPDNVALELAGALDVSLIDQVRQGMPVTIAFSSLNHAHTPELQGEVKTVAADSLVNERTGFPFYPIRFSIDQKDLQKLAVYSIQPGVPAEVFINAGERTLLNYLFKPLTDRMRNSLTEE